MVVRLGAAQLKVSLSLLSPNLDQTTPFRPPNLQMLDETADERIRSVSLWLEGCSEECSDKVSSQTSLDLTN